MLSVIAKVEITDVLQLSLEKVGVLATLRALEEAMERIADPSDGGEGSKAYFALNEVQAAIERLVKMKMENDLGSSVNDPDVVADWKKNNHHA